MPRLITFEVYPFNELSESAKQKAVEDNSYINVDMDIWYDCVEEEWMEKLKVMGFEDPEIQFSGFYSQGDGASFSCKRFDVSKFLKSTNNITKYQILYNAIQDSNTAEISARVIRHTHQYSHEYTTHLELESFFYEDEDITDDPYPYESEQKREFDLQIDYFVDWMKTVIVDLNRAIYKDLEAEYDALTSRESIEDTLESNEILFHEDGGVLSRQWMSVAGLP